MKRQRRSIVPPPPLRFSIGDHVEAHTRNGDTKICTVHEVYPDTGIPKKVKQVNQRDYLADNYRWDDAQYKLVPKIGCLDYITPGWCAPDPLLLDQTCAFWKRAGLAQVRDSDEELWHTVEIEGNRGGPDDLVIEPPISRLWTPPATTSDFFELLYTGKVRLHPWVQWRVYHKVKRAALYAMWMGSGDAHPHGIPNWRHIGRIVARMVWESRCDVAWY